MSDLRPRYPSKWRLLYKFGAWLAYSTLLYLHMPNYLRNNEMVYVVLSLALWTFLTGYVIGTLINIGTNLMQAYRAYKKYLSLETQAHILDNQYRWWQFYGLEPWRVEQVYDLAELDGDALMKSNPLAFVRYRSKANK